MRATRRRASRGWIPSSSIASSPPSRAISRTARGTRATARCARSPSTTSVSVSSLRGGDRRALVVAHLRRDLRLHLLEELRPLLLRDLVDVLGVERDHALAA